jgi:iron complex outermembrane receptor protein
MKSILFLVIGLFVSNLVLSQGVSGYVYDNQSNDVLIGANVVIKGTTQGVVTDVNGFFELSGSLNFPLKLTISYIGYKNTDIEVAKPTQKLKIKVESENLQLGEVQVVDSRITDKQKQAAQTIEALDIIGIKQTASSDFYEGIGAMKAVDVTSASMGFKVINTRGFNSTNPVRSLQLIDGVDNQSPGLNFSLGNFLGASELDVQKLELIAGANGALYGPNAFNGVVYMTTKDPFIHQGLSISAKAGERNLKEVALRFAHAFGKQKGEEKLAIKGNFFYMSAYDWEANNLNPTEQSEHTASNPGSYDAVNRYGDENLTEGQNNATSLSGQVQTPGLGRWYRTGYEEKDIVNYNTENLKASAAIHYKINKARLIASSSFGSGTTIYQGDNRYALKDITFFQHKLEYKQEDKFFLRTYYTHENAGNSYDAVFTAFLLQDAAKNDVDWQKDYRNYWNSNVKSKITSLDGYPTWNPFLGTPFPFSQLDSLLGTIQDSLFVYHNQAEAFANTQNPLNPEDLDRFEPGTARFDSAYQSITSKKSFLQGGSGLFDKSALWHAQGEYKFEPMIDSVKIVDLILGGSYRKYMPNSNGTIFNEVPIIDTVSGDTSFTKITNEEYGIYTGISKKLLDEKLMASATLRMDKNQNFDYLFSPAASLVYTHQNNHVFRVAFSSAIRNPTLADQYLKYDVGRAILLGNVNGYDSLVTTESLYDYFGTPNLDTDTLVYFNLDPIRPEKVKTIEAGYRGTLWNKIYVDANYYYSFYTDFIGYTVGVDLTFDTLYTNRLTDAQAYRIASNAKSIVTTQGFSLSTNYYFRKHYSINANYSWNKLNKVSVDDPIIPAYNTPEHKFNFGVSGNGFTVLKVPNVGFNVNYKWIQGFVFEGSPQFTGFVPTYDMVDAQINWKWLKYKTFFKLGASNILGIYPLFDKTIASQEEKNKKVFQNKNMQVYGGPFIGRMLYFSVTIELDRL